MLDLFDLPAELSEYVLEFRDKVMHSFLFASPPGRGYSFGKLS